jgi:hypothetical protein
MFYLAFENTIETGYVTEKAWDALMSGRNQSIVQAHIFRIIFILFELKSY